MNGFGLLAVGLGVFWFCAAVFDWSWFWERGRQGWAADLLGRDVARVLYGLLGAAVIVLGVMLTFGWIRGAH